MSRGHTVTANKFRCTLSVSISGDATGLTRRASGSISQLEDCEGEDSQSPRCNRLSIARRGVRSPVAVRRLDTVAVVAVGVRWDWTIRSLGPTDLHASHIRLPAESAQYSLNPKGDERLPRRMRPSANDTQHTYARFKIEAATIVEQSESTLAERNPSEQ